MTDEELIARAREAGAELRRRPGDLDRLAGALLAELADRLAAPAAVITTWCGRCRHATASVPCDRCGRPVCAGCRRCPDCGGDLPGEETGGQSR